MNAVSEQEPGRKYFLNIEGVGDEVPWDADTITPAQLRELASWPVTQEIVEVNLETSEETTLSENSVVQLKPGHGFGKKIKFKRG